MQENCCKISKLRLNYNERTRISLKFWNKFWKTRFAKYLNILRFAWRYIIRNLGLIITKIPITRILQGLSWKFSRWFLTLLLVLGCITLLSAVPIMEVNVQSSVQSVIRTLKIGGYYAVPKKTPMACEI